MIEFEKFFAGEFQRRLEQTTVPGMADASWDRKAAWLLWQAENRVLTGWVDNGTTNHITTLDAIPTPKPGLFD